MRNKRKGAEVSSSRGKRVKLVGEAEMEADVFWMSLEEAKQAISDKYEYLAERYERRKPKSKQ